MATKKKVASKTTRKAVPAKKSPAKKAPVAKKKAAPAPKTSAKKAAPKKPVAAPKKAAPAKKAAAKPVTKKPVAKPAAKKAAPAPAKKKPATPVKKAAPAPKAPVKKAAPIAKKPEVAKQVISKPEVKVDIMPAKSKQEKPGKDTGKKGKTAPKAEAPAAKVVARPAPKSAASRSTTKPTLKAVSYQPEFIKSVLDQPDQPTGPIYRYSDPELQEFKEIILKKLDAAKKELVYLQGLITRKDEAGTDDTENKYMSMEDGSGSQEREQLNQMASRQIQFIDHLEKAMVRIENKTYGICRVTGKLIDKARLKAVPHATLSIEAKLAKK